MDCCNSLNELSDKRLLPFQIMLDFMDPYLSNIRRSLSNSGVSLELLRTSFFCFVAVAIFLFAAAAPVRLLYSKKKKKRASMIKSTQVAREAPEAFRFNYAAIEDKDDYKYSMELQIQEVILASLTPELNNASSSIPASFLDPKPVQIKKGVGNLLQSFCEICLEDRESWQMFKNDSCGHSFCYECTSKHIVARIQDNLKMIRCPGASCKATLDFNACRSMIPKDVVARWDESLCLSLIPESQKLFCPFHDCSVLLIDELGGGTKRIKCPVCRRSFCALCRVPWHSEFSCEEFQKLNAKRTGKYDLMFRLLAKKRNWQLCPSCKMHVEKTEGCLHITCRCSYEFCYKCGSKWTGSHSCKKT